MAIGAIAGIALGAVVAHEAHDPLVTLVAFLLCTCATLRVIAAYYFSQTQRSEWTASAKISERSYEFGAWMFALLIGVMAMVSLIRSDNLVSHVMSVALSAGYAGGISGRNAGRVHIAVGQVILCLSPTIIGLLIVGTTSYLVLAFVLTTLIFGLADISYTTKRIVMDALLGRIRNERLARRYKVLANCDSLTGVENRFAIEERMQSMVRDCAATGRAMAIIWIDLDRFKQINDALGHFVGDEVLKEVTRRMMDQVGERLSIARFGGDEFILLCDNCDAEHAKEITALIMSCFQDSVKVGKHLLRVTPSIGVASFPEHGETVDQLMQNADVALYTAKKGGRNKICIFDWSSKEKLRRQQIIEEGLATAIEREEFSLFYQPVYSIATGKVEYCEALIRWDSSEHGRIAPDEFIPIAESIGLIEKLSEWVLREACRTLAKWPEDVGMAINISPALLKDDTLAHSVIAATVEYGVAPRRLELEMTENIFLEENIHTSHIIRELQQIGLRLALDDFGTGYSSLSYLRNFPFDTVKVDKSFLAGIEEHDEDRGIVESIAFLARSLKLSSVAEGIETPEQLRYARTAGFSHVQGYLMSMPVPASQLDELLKTDRGANLFATLMATDGKSMPSTAPEPRRAAS